MNAEYKKLALEHRKNGNEFISYLIGKDDSVKNISPKKWFYLDLPDTTSEHQSNKCYRLLANKIRESLSFGQFLDLVNKAKAKNISYRENPREWFYWVKNK